MKKVLIVLICVLLLVGCGKKDEETKKEDKSTFSAEVTVRDREVEIGTKIDNLDAVKVEKGKIISKKEDLDTSKIGVQNIKVTIEDENGNKKDYEYTVTVIDKKKPTITYSKKLTTTQGTKINLLNGVSVKDDSMEELKINIEGEYDFNKVGTYTLYYVAEDSSGNKAREEFTLTVKEKPAPTPTPTPSNTANNVCEPVQDGTFTTSNGHSGVTKNGITYIDGIMIANKTYSLPSSYGPGGLTGETNAAANEMFAAAKAAGYNMWAQSGFRSYDTQKRLYNNYVSQRGKSAADTFSARPGHSEHQTGLAFDVCATGKACINSGFDNTPEAKWLSENAYKYGFVLRYPSGKTGQTGYKYESWHFRYVGVELATKLYNGGNWITLEEYFGITSQYSC